MLVARALRRMAKCSLSSVTADCNNHLSTYTVDQATNIKWYEGAVSRRGILIVMEFHPFVRPRY